MHALPGGAPAPALRSTEKARAHEELRRRVRKRGSVRRWAPGETGAIISDQ